MPVSVTRDADVIALALGRDLDPPARLGVLRRVGQEVRHDLREPRRIGVDHEACGRHVRDAAAVSRCSRSGLAISIALATTSPISTGSRPELDLAARDARDIEQVVDQPDQVLDLALDDRPLLLEPSVRRAGA